MLAGQRLATLTAVLAADIGGFLCFWMGFPAGWFVGATLLVGILAIVGVPVHCPGLLRDSAFVVLGFSIGAGLTPEMFARLSLWPVSLAGMVVTVLLTVFLASKVLNSGFGWDLRTSRYAAMPGALTPVTIAAAETEARTDQVSSVQIIRLILITLLFPIAFSSSAPGPAYDTPPAGVVTDLDWTFWTASALSIASALALKKLGVRAGALIGSLVASGLLHAIGFTENHLPEIVRVVTYVVVGGYIGSKLADLSEPPTWRLLLAGATVTATGFSVSIAMVVLVSAITSLPWQLLLVAYAPGGIEVMTIVALGSGLDATFTGLHQLARYFLLLGILPFMSSGVSPRKKQPLKQGSAK